MNPLASEGATKSQELTTEVAGRLVSGSFDLDILLGLAAVFLGLSVIVQALQEIYKFLTTSKARAYRKALRDFLGPEVEKEGAGEGLASLLLRGPFQIIKDRTPAHLLPMTRDGLVHALIRTAPKHVRRGMQVFTHEVRIQQGTPGKPSPILSEWIDELWKAKGKDGCANKIFGKLMDWGVASKPPAANENPPVRTATVNTTVDASSILQGLKDQFLPKVNLAEQEYGQFSGNFDHVYRRRNLRQTVVFGFLLAMLLNLPLSGLYQHAQSLSPEEVAKITESAVALQKLMKADTEVGQEGTNEPESSPNDTDGSESAKTDDAGDNKDITAEEVPEGESPAQQRQTAVEGTAPVKGTQEETHMTATPASDHVAKGGQQLHTEEKTQAGGDGSNGENLTPEHRINKLLDGLHNVVNTTVRNEGDKYAPFSAGWSHLKYLCLEDRKMLLKHLLNCFLTALLIAFGAPFWHRLSTALLGMRRPTTG